VGSKLADCVEDGIIEPGGFLRGAEPLLVGFYVGEVERISGAQAAVHQLVAGFEQQADALAGADLEVVPALGQTFRLASRSGLKMGWRQPRHLIHRPSVRTVLPAASTALSSPEPDS